MDDVLTADPAEISRADASLPTRWGDFRISVFRFDGTEVVALSVDIADAVAKDDLAAALDISGLAACVREEVGRRPRALLERMTADVAQTLLQRFPRVTEVTVKIEKPDPEGLDAAAEAVELTIASPRSARAASPRSQPRPRA